MIDLSMVIVSFEFSVFLSGERYQGLYIQVNLKAGSSKARIHIANFRATLLRHKLINSSRQYLLNKTLNSLREYDYTPGRNSLGTDVC